MAKKTTERVQLKVVTPEKDLTPRQCGPWLQRTVAQHFPQVVEGFLREAVKGGTGHLKMATEMLTGPATKAGKKIRRRPAATILAELERRFPDV